MKSRALTIVILSCLLTACAASRASAQQQNFDISSGGQPTITGALNGSVAGSSSALDNLSVNISFGEVSPANTNNIVKVVVPIAIRSIQPYQITVSITGTSNMDPRAIRFSDIGFGADNMRVLGGKAQICTRSSHIFYAPLNNDPSTTATLNASGRVAYQSTLANITSSTLILSGPKLTQGTSISRRTDDGWVFDAVFVITPQYFASSTASASLIFTISSGPNVQC